MVDLSPVQQAWTLFASGQSSTLITVRRYASGLVADSAGQIGTGAPTLTFSLRAFEDPSPGANATGEDRGRVTDAQRTVFFPGGDPGLVVTTDDGAPGQPADEVILPGDPHTWLVVSKTYYTPARGFVVGLRRRVRDA